MQALTEKKYMIVGAGLTGVSVARWCLRHGYAFDLCDTRTDLANAEQIRQEFPEARLFLGELETQRLVRYEQLVVSPGVALANTAIVEARQQGVGVSGDIQLFAEHCQQPIIAITGSNGKTTVATLVGELLSAAGKTVALGGNIGVPALDLPAAELSVLELSSFQLETTEQLNAEVAVILNISADHMDRYTDLDTYIAAKQKVFNGCSKPVFNRDDLETQPRTQKAVGVFSAHEPQAGEFGVVQKYGKEWIAYGEETLIATDELKLKGRHNILNAVAALAIVQQALPVDVRLCLPALKAFTGLPYRCQWLGVKDGVAFYNDSKGTNVGATLAAIDGVGKDIKGKVWLLLGGEGKGQDFSPLTKACQRYAAEVQVFGADRHIIAQAIDSECTSYKHETLDEAFNRSRLMATEGDVILFSPACASFDQFEDYQARGAYFTSLVEAVI